MFAEMRRRNKQLPDDEALRVLSEGDYGVLSVIDESGYPYGVPLNYAYHDGKIYIHCALNEGQKVKDMRAEDRVCFSVTTRSVVLAEKFSTDFESVIVFGRAAEVFGEEKNAALLALIEKYSAEFMEKGRAYIARAADKTGVYAVTIEHITAKATKRS